MVDVNYSTTIYLQYATVMDPESLGLSRAARSMEI